MAERRGGGAFGNIRPGINYYLAIGFQAAGADPGPAIDGLNDVRYKASPGIIRLLTDAAAKRGEAPAWLSTAGH